MRFYFEMLLQVSHDGRSLIFHFSPAESSKQKRTLIFHSLLAVCVVLVEVRYLEFAFRVYCKNKILLTSGFYKNDL